MEEEWIWGTETFEERVNEGWREEEVIMGVRIPVYSVLSNSKNVSKQIHNVSIIHYIYYI